MTKSASRGRPPSSSRDMLQDAAFELFLEQSYAGTSIDSITQRAGVSRNTFFNYFAAKSDVFWVDLDESVGTLDTALRDSSPEVPAMQAVRDAVLATGAQFGPSRVPFALTQVALIGSVNELRSSALTRFSQQARILRVFLEGRSRSPKPLLARAAAYAVCAATVAAAQSWAAAGTSRGPLEPYLADALDPLVAGFQPALDAA